MLTTPAIYRIRVQGQLRPEWVAFFGGLTLSWQEPDQTVLSGQVIDQAALHGILNTIRDLGLPLVEVLRLGPEEKGNGERERGAERAYKTLLANDIRSGMGPLSAKKQARFGAFWLPCEAHFCPIQPTMSLANKVL